MKLFPVYVDLDHFVECVCDPVSFFGGAANLIVLVQYSSRSIKLIRLFFSNYLRIICLHFVEDDWALDSTTLEFFHPHSFYVVERVQVV